MASGLRRGHTRSASSFRARATSQYLCEQTAAKMMPMPMKTPTTLTTTMNQNQVEEFTYHLCYNYFNFMGSIKVPAAVMYAHKVANYANDLAILPSDRLCTNLHYL